MPSKTDQDGRGHVRYLDAPTVQAITRWQVAGCRQHRRRAAVPGHEQGRHPGRQAPPGARTREGQHRARCPPGPGRTSEDARRHRAGRASGARRALHPQCQSRVAGRGPPKGSRSRRLPVRPPVRLSVWCAARVPPIAQRRSMARQAAYPKSGPRGPCGPRKRGFKLTHYPQVRRIVHRRHGLVFWISGGIVGRWKEQPYETSLTVAAARPTYADALARAAEHLNRRRGSVDATAAHSGESYMEALARAADRLAVPLSAG